MHPTLTDALTAPAMATDPAAPLVTYYDDATGERIELSAITLMNWAAKTANLVRDEFGLEPGARVAVLLPAHWQTAAVLLGLWWAGAEVTPAPDPGAELALTTIERFDDVADLDEVAVLSLDAFGRPVPDLPAGVTDYATSVRVHGDQYRPMPASPTAPALDGRCVEQVLAAARESAARQQLVAGDRVLSTPDWHDVDALVDGLLAPLAAGASLVLVTNPDLGALERRAEMEKVTKRR
ncbi:TIGR03089 family protein [Speluncibacter jeojiensis]|uniref:TIGR03089 family protein n=1 Tax=Speluncibacter jeojiensis TaxID=2710754 RepID=A0A9X4LX93_9ACTN|nr:TIGR03089 family protein [Corynebacteriales bacterium D3-21]